MFQLRVRFPQSALTMNLFYWFELRSISEFKAALRMGYFGSGPYSTSYFHPGNSDGYFAEDTLGSRSGLVMHARDSVPN